MEGVADSIGSNLESPGSLEAPTMTEGGREALAKRIAAVLDERRIIGEMRRQPKHEYRLRNVEPARGPYRRLRGEPKRVGRWTNELDAMYNAVISSGTADVAIQAHRVMEVCWRNNQKEIGLSGVHGNAHT